MCRIKTTPKGQDKAIAFHLLKKATVARGLNPQDQSGSGSQPVR